MLVFHNKINTINQGLSKQVKLPKRGLDLGNSCSSK